ncbi:MAG: hypothetical protein RL480_50, partial [Pseudomonadota bacterium]
MVPTIKRRSLAPATATGQHALDLGNEIAAIGNQLSIETHHRLTRFDLFGRKKRRLQFGN